MYDAAAICVKIKETGIRERRIELVTSYVLDYENSNNRSMQKRMTIEKFMEDIRRIEADD